MLSLNLSGTKSVDLKLGEITSSGQSLSMSHWGTTEKSEYDPELCMRAPALNLEQTCGIGAQVVTVRQREVKALNASACSISE